MRSSKRNLSKKSWNSPSNPLKSIDDLRSDSIKELENEHNITNLQDLKKAVENDLDLTKIHGIGPKTEKNIIEKLVTVTALQKKYLKETKND